MCVCVRALLSCPCCSDEGVNFAVQKGVEASRSKVRYFKHNDVDHLRKLLEEQQQQDIKVGVAGSRMQTGLNRFVLVAPCIYVCAKMS